MSDDVVIRAEGLGKKYVIGHEERERYVALRDVLARTAKGLWRKTADMARGRPIVIGDRTEDFWALKDVSFEVRRGEVLGVIGRNGAGKSTLLKVLSRITEPTEGRVTIEGRVASLLEVGTGFHPELTGRENVYLNGAILGMTRAEIRRKFDEIVDFAGVEQFLDTPVKRYSSGMQVRLAFAVAAHLEPEILVVDEVLAVGDAEFQKKCLGKMEDVASHGRTVLFVSHNMAAVSALCTRGLLLKAGRSEMDSDVNSVSRCYLRLLSTSSGVTDSLNNDRSDLVVTRLEVVNFQGRRGTAINSGTRATIRLALSNISGSVIPDVNVALGVKNASGQVIALIESRYLGRLMNIDTGEVLVEFCWPRVPFSAGSYSLSVRLDSLGVILSRAADAGLMRVEGGDYYGAGAVPPAHVSCVMTTFDFDFASSETKA
ncbi:MAG: ATP-binding cassette domain-containing protein [bacterium]|nr:ATP-binding cassette domain-containing protein [bacterium]